MIDFTYTVWIVLIPLFMFVIIGFWGNKFKPVVSGIAGTTGLFVSMALSWYTAYQYFFVVPKVNGAYQALIGYNTVWLRLTEKLHIDLGTLLDPISVMMLIVITTVSFFVHFYSIGYMKGEKGFERFFSFLSLFSFSMLGLVVATNIFQMYIFWELVGVSSYLLIGFYYERSTAVAASKKAFIVTRFADLGFLIGILILSYTTGTFDFLTLTNPAGSAITQGGSILFLGMSTMTWSMIFVFMGGAGKSAMFPLHIWLPDAMEGPTPVSALIHAATMVVAGVYLVARMFPIYHFAAPQALEVVAYVGGFTSLFAAVIACTQMDIKRVLAYSTMSQIGYMMLALGISGYGGEEGLGFMASMFHLFTHAFFKALLFLAAGAIIHAVHTNYMNEMGGLRKHLPITYWTFFIALLSIAGIAPMAGFWSKDEILVACWMNNKLLFINAVFVAGLTAFYMSRLFFSVFHGVKREYHHVPHEAPWTMTVPLLFLALGAAIAGFLPFHELVTSDNKPFATELHLGIAIPASLVAIAGIAVAYIFYFRENNLPERTAKALKGLYTASFHKFYIDEVYLFITKRIIFNYISRPVAWFDRHIVDGTMNGFSYLTNEVSGRIKSFQSGQLQQYAWVFVTGAIALALAFIYLWTI